MEQAKKNRSANRTHDEMRVTLNEKIAYHHLQINKLNSRLADLDKPKEPRKTRLGMNKAVAEIKAAGITPEQILQFIAAQKGAVTA